MNWQTVAQWLLIGGGLSLVVIPAIKYWLLRGYVLNSAFETYKKKCAEETKNVTDGLRSRVADLATTMQTYIAMREQTIARVVALETKMEVFWNTIIKKATDMLHRDDTPDIDRLLEDLQARRLTRENAEILKTYLERIEETADRPAEDKSIALLLLATINALFTEPKGMYK